MINTENHNPLLDDPELRPSAIYDNAAYVQEARNKVHLTFAEQVAIAQAALKRDTAPTSQVNFDAQPSQMISEMPNQPAREIDFEVQAREMIADQSNTDIGLKLRFV
jgi:primosomal protein N''